MSFDNFLAWNKQGLINLYSFNNGKDIFKQWKIGLYSVNP